LRLSVSFTHLDPFDASPVLCFHTLQRLRRVPLSLIDTVEGFDVSFFGIAVFA